MSEDIRSRRVAVAEDVKAQILAGRYRFRRQRGYLHSIGGRTFGGLGGDLQEYVDEVALGCDICQIGGLLLSKARLFNAAPMPKWDQQRRDISRTEAVEALKDTFDRDTLGLLESAFEGPDEVATVAMMRACGGVPWQGRMFGAKAYMLGWERFGSASARVWCCMNNLILNGGEFRPDQEPVLDLE